MTMALDDLLHAIERDAETEIRAIRAAGEAEAARIEADAAQARAQRIAAAIAAFAGDRRAAADLELATAARCAQADLLAARSAMLDRIRAAICAELPALVADQPRLGARLLAAVLAYAGDAAGTLRCAPSLVDAARAAAPPSLRVEGDPAVSTGAIVELAAGTRIDATLAALLEREWPGLACEALAMERVG
jgi:vacuolar-type H+-ATPase subunit E/Vma4